MYLSGEQLYVLNIAHTIRFLFGVLRWRNEGGTEFVRNKIGNKVPEVHKFQY